MDELYELVKAFNRLKEKIIELIGKIDLLIKTPAPASTDVACYVCTPDGYVEEEGACRILHISPRTLAYLRADGSIPYIKKGRRIQYLVGDLNSYLEQIKTRRI